MLAQKFVIDAVKGINDGTTTDMTLDVDYSRLSGLKLIAFDLDGTIWDPEMYQLWGGGAPFRLAPNKKDLLDSKGTVLRLLGVTAEILHDIKCAPELNGTKIAWVSCTDEPVWANECLGLLVTQPGQVPLDQVADASEIFDGNKQLHFKGLKETFPDIDFNEMLFFDNQQNNIASVSKLGVKCVYCPNGMTLEIWMEGLKRFMK
jgi:magnesium-dependent phosphatase 1